MKLTAPKIREAKKADQKLTMVTAYDYTFGKLLDEAGVDIILVGDSLGMVVQGRKNTLGVTLDQMIYHTHCVSRGVKNAHLILDMPFLSYQVSKNQALRSAGLALKKGHAEAVKLEGGVEIAESVRYIVENGIPVMGHVGLMPQRVQAMGGYKIQGREKETAKQIIKDAKAITEAGAYAIVLEGIPAELGKKITNEVSIPTIGIGSGPDCDGQVLVCYDLLGMFPDISPKFVKKYANLHETIVKATQKYIQEVKSGNFPTQEHSYS